MSSTAHIERSDAQPADDLAELVSYPAKGAITYSKATVQLENLGWDGHLSRDLPTPWRWRAPLLLEAPIRTRYSPLGVGGLVAAEGTVESEAECFTGP